MKILIISQHIFPMQTPRAHRTTELMKEFARRGHQVTVYAVLGSYDYGVFEKKYQVIVKPIPIKWQLTPYSSDLKTKRRLLDRVLGKVLKSNFEFPEIEFKYRIKEILEKEKNVDLLISIGDPHHIHWGCARAKNTIISGFPNKWIADCGDPFMMNNQTKDHKLKYEKDERNFCELVDFITVPVMKAPEMYYKEYRSKFKIIPQGFKFVIPEKNSFKQINEIPTFVFAGTFLSDIRNPTKLFEFLVEYDKPFRFVIYTKYLNLISPYIPKLGNKIEIRDQVSRVELLSELGKMDFLLNIENINSPGQTPSKLIDYSIANRPILSINPDNPDCKLVKEFLTGNYTGLFEVENLKQFKIENVVDKFLAL
jgi:hypothetical protein